MNGNIAKSKRSKLTSPFPLLAERRPQVVVILLAAAAGCIPLVLACAVAPVLSLVVVVALVLGICMVAYPALAMALLVAFFVLQESPLYEHYGVLASRAGTLSDLAGLLVLGGVSWERINGADTWSLLRNRGLPAFLAVCAFFWWATATSLWSSAPTAVITVFLRLQVEAPVILLLSLLALRDRRRVRWAAAAYALAGVALAAYTITTYSGHAGFTAGASYSAQEHAYRGGQTGYNQNELALLLALVPVMAYVCLERALTPLRWLLTALTGCLVLLAMVILSSRGPLIGLGLGIVLAAILSANMRARISALGAVALGAIAFGAISVAGALPRYFVQRFQLIGSDQIGGRGPVWRLALFYFDRNPLGLGAMSFEHLLPSAYVTLYATLTAVNNDFVGTLVDLGIVGETLLIVMLGVLLWSMFRHAGRDPALIIIATVAIVAMFTGDRLGTHSFWVILSLGFCYALTATPTKHHATSPVQAVLKEQ